MFNVVTVAGRWEELEEALLLMQTDAVDYVEGQVGLDGLQVLKLRKYCFLGFAREFEDPLDLVERGVAREDGLAVDEFACLRRVPRMQPMDQMSTAFV